MRPPHQVIYTHGGGRLGNQVLRFAHWMAWALEQEGDVEVRDLAFWPYAHFFEFWRRHPGCVFPLRPDRWDEVARWRRLLPEPVSHRLDWRVQHAVHALGSRRAGWQKVKLNDMAGEVVDLVEAGFMNGIRKHRGTTCAGWRISHWTAVARHQSELRGFFRPARDYVSAPRAFVEGLRARHGFVLGVQIRQGDYRIWHDGRFLFSPIDYARWIRQALEAQADRQPVAVIVSDEPVDAAVFEGMPVHVRQGEAWFEDWVALSMCDAILCPPSTFSATAAWVGGRMLWPVTRRDQVLNPAQMIPDGIVGAARHPEFKLAVK